MEKIFDKNSIIYKYMDKYRRRNITRMIVLIILLLTYFLFFKPYITTVLFGSTPLDEIRFKADVKSGYLNETYDSTHNVINAKTVKNYSYWQDDNYKFDIIPGNVCKTGISYTTRNTDADFNEEKDEEILSAQLYTVEINGQNTLVLAYPHQKVKTGEKITGIFTQIPPVVKSDIASCADYNGKEYGEYMLDIRGIQMENEMFDITVSAILAALILFLLAKTIYQYIRPLSTPTYRNLEKYGDLLVITEDVESQLKSKEVTSIGKKTAIYTEGWIVSRDTFKLKIVKNHAKPQDSSRYGSKL